MNVDPRLFELYTSKRIEQIIDDLADRREIASRFNYVGAGAAHWAAMAHWMTTATAPNGRKADLQLLAELGPWLRGRLEGAPPVRVVDLGPGDGLAGRALMAALPAVGRYVAVDVSEAMLAVAAGNLAGRQVVTVCRDFELDPLTDLRAADGVCTVVLLVGGTLFNMASPVAVLRAVRDVLRPGDVLLCGARLDDPASRASFVFGPDGGDSLAAQDRVVPDLLRIPRDRYTPEQGFDGVLRQRYIRIRLGEPISVDFGGGRVVRLGAGETVQLWRYHHHSHAEVRDLVTGAGFSVAAERRTADGQFLLLAAVAS